ncbi:14 kDa phosphohistidine phosphatase [Rhinoraja longicauda]
MAAALARVPAVVIDPSGVFKYVLIRVGQDGGSERDVVRGWAAAEYHADIYDQVSAEIERQGLYCECQGGGRIRHDNQEKKIHVYGYSIGFGRAKHETTTEILRAKYPDYAVTWADEDY